MPSATVVKNHTSHYDEPMNLGMPEMIFIFLLALVVVGPKRLPGLARQLGKYMAEFKRASNEFKNQLETEMMNIELDERVRKDTEAAKALPPQTSLEPAILPPVGIVSRGSSDAIAAPEAESAAELPPAPPLSPAPAPARSSPDA
jgi:sec-independent protein translocase protein TatB